MPSSKKLLIFASHRDRSRAAECLKEAGRALASALRMALPDGYEFVVALRHEGSVAFFSDSPKPEATAIVREVLGELEQ